METELPPSESIEKKAEALGSLIAGPLSSASSRLLCRSRGLPSDKDFHFYNNFDEFKLPAKEITTKTKSSLGEIASSVSLWGSKKPPPLPDELDEAYDWLVNLNDDFLEKFGISMDEFRSSREKHELQKEVVESGDGFQLVCGKKKKRDIELNQERYGGLSPSSGIKIVSIDKKTIAARAKVPFHLPNIPRPQIEFNILVNNKNQPFDHVWLEKSEDRSYFIHPMEKLSVPDFIDRNIKADEIVKPLSLERTQFKFVEGVNDLKEMARKLREVNEFAVDLEHNNYRSFLGLTCLMQISTRTEDFIVDTLKVRVHIGPYLRELFKDPLKKKIMHGADCDILWLQRDFGIYVCNLFDTGQASRVLDLERNSLEYLLHHFCGVQANKEYQKADWRIRPLPDEMIKYAREDTHYLLHIYDLMRCMLLSSSSDGNDLLLEVYKRSSKVCMQLYEKELMTDTSYLYTYGLAEADFDSKQLAIVSGLCAWRDTIAREEDESTGYVLPNKAVLEIARQMPQTTGHLRQMVKSKHPYVYRHLNAVIKIINHAIANSSAFDCVVEELKKKRMEALAIQASQADNPDSVTETNHSIDQIASTCQEEKKMQQLSLLEMTSPMVGEVEKNTNNEASSSSQLHEEAIPTASIQVLKKPAKGFGALFGNSSRKTVPLNGSASEKEKNEIKVEQIKASVALPFFPFFGRGVVSEPAAKSASPPPIVMQTPEQPPITTRLTEDIIPLEDHSDGRSLLPECSTSWEENAVKSNADTRQSGMSLSDLSAGFQQCSNYISKGWEANREPSPYVAPFDYSAARKNLRFGEVRKGSGGEADAGTNSGHLPASSRDARKGLRGGRNAGEEGQRGQQPRRRQAFPNSGNRSTTYRC